MKNFPYKNFLFQISIKLRTKNIPKIQLNLTYERKINLYSQKKNQNSAFKYLLTNYYADNFKNCLLIKKNYFYVSLCCIHIFSLFTYIDIVIIIFDFFFLMMRIYIFIM